MNIAIMQPYFFPYLGYISLIKNTERFILLDTVQFIRHGWIERNRILKPESGWQYIQIPLVKVAQKTLIKDIQINNSLDWKRKILAQLQHYKNSAPYYHITINLLNTIFEIDYDNIVAFNKKALEVIIEYLGFNKKIEIYSQMNLPIMPVKAPDEWALNICIALGSVDEYWNPPGGQSFFDKTKYNQSNIDLKFHSIRLTEYHQKQDSFEPGLSIIDVLMFNGVETINKMLDNYEINGL